MVQSARTVASWTGLTFGETLRLTRTARWSGIRLLRGKITDRWAFEDGINGWRVMRVKRRAGDAASPGLRECEHAAVPVSCKVARA